MATFPYTTLVTLLALGVFLWTLVLVSHGRSKFDISAPAVTGNEDFERRFRVQMNTLEQLAIMLPALWLCAVWAGDLYAAVGGLVWSVGRILYGMAYIDDPAKREVGFLLTIFPTIAMAIAAGFFAIRSLT